LQQLPDVPRALDNPFDSNALESLHRAYDIFEHISGNEVAAILALTAEVQVRRGESPISTLQQLKELQQSTSVQLAIAKSYWMQGEFTQAANVCQQVLENNTNDNSVMVAARNGYALSQLLQASSLDDLFVVRDPFRRNAMHHTQWGVTAMNMGVAHVVYADLLSQHRPATDIPIDPALREWKQGLTWWKKHASKKHNMALLIQSQLQANMAWGLLQLQDIEQASKYARDSLKLLEQQQKQESNLALTIPLTLLAQCYHKSGGAVTAEGLLQTAISVPPPRTLSEKLQLRYALRAYAALCRDWDKRGGDAERLTAQADEIELPQAWRHKDSFVYTSVWFWMPSDLLYRVC
jgi:tetratricopeptide (TPR) repeat protein